MAERSRPSWRGGEKAGGRPAPRGAPPPQKKRRWFFRAEADHRRQLRRHRLRTAAWTTAFLALLGLFVFWIIPIPVPPPLCVGVVVQYETPIPPNAFAQEDAERLLELRGRKTVRFPDDTPQFQDVVWASRETGLRRLADQVAKVRPGGPDKNVIIVYLSVHGAVNGDGQPCVIPPGASAYDSSQWLQVRELLETLFPPENAALRSDRLKKLLVLDCTRLDQDWAWGLLHNDFAGRLDKARREAGVPGLAILSAAAPGQQALAAPELGGSVFNFFFTRGIAGEADGHASRRYDGVVTLGEFYGYLQDRVGGWVGGNRADVQGPVLLPGGEDFPLAYASSDGELPARNPVWPDDRALARIDELWHVHAQLRQGPAWRLDPLKWAQLERRLLEAERLAEAGKAYAPDADLAIEQAERLARQLAEPGPPEGLPAGTLALARLWESWPTAAEIDALPAPWRPPPSEVPKGPAAGAPEASVADEGAAKVETPVGSEAPQGPSGNANAESAPGAAAEPSKAKTQATAGPPAAAAPKEDPPYGYLAACAAVWEQLSREPQWLDRLPELVEFVDGAADSTASRAGRTPSDYAEIHLLRMFDAHLDWESPNLAQRPMQHVWQAIGIRDLSESVATARDERAHYWTRPLVDEGDRRRRRAEDALFVGNTSALTEAEAAWTALRSEGGEYARAVEVRQRVEKAYEVRDRAWAVGLHLAQWALGHPGREGEELAAAVPDMIHNSHALGQALDAWLRQQEWPEREQDLARRLEAALDKLEEAYDRECAELAETAGHDVHTLRRIAAVLKVPPATGVQRGKLRRKYFAILEALSSGKDLSVGKGLAEVSQPGSTGEAMSAEVSRCLDRQRGWKEHPALAALRREWLQDSASFSGATATPSAVPVVGGEPSKGEGKSLPDSTLLAREQVAQRLAAEGEEVRRLAAGVGAETEAWVGNAKQRGPLAGPGEPFWTGRESYSRADRLLRAAAPLMNPVVSAPAAARLLRTFDLRSLLLWYAQRTLDDFWGPRPGASEPYFLTTATAYLKAAGRLEGAPDRYLGWAGPRAAAALEGIRPTVDVKNPVFDEAEESFGHGFSLTLAEHLPAGLPAMFVEDSLGLLPLEERSSSEDGVAIRRMGLTDLAPGTHPGPKYRIPNDERLARGDHWSAVVLYRGHKWRDDFYPGVAGGLDIVYQPPSASPSTITVSGQSKKAAAVMFVFDCSYSMKEHGRLEPARRTLQMILARLAESPLEYHVGLLVYGHRVNRRNPSTMGDIPGKYVTCNAGGKAIARPPELSHVFPNNDWEIIRPVQPFDENDLGDAVGELGGLPAWGVTPLYLSIIEALGALDRAHDVEQKRVVVITDGVNYQPTDGEVQNDKWVRTLANLEEALHDRPDVRLDVVGFQVAGEDEEDRRGREELRRAAERPQVSWYDTQDVAALLTALEDSLGLAQYDVLAIRGGGQVSRQALNPDPLDLNRTCKDVPPGEYRVQLTDKRRPAQMDVVVGSGAAIQLQLREEGGRRWLEHPHYTRDLRDQSADVVAPEDPRQRFLLGAHAAARDPHDRDGLWFTLSVQNADPSRFSPRPAEAWVEITPVPEPEDADAPRLYRYYDVCYDRPGVYSEDERSVPVIKLYAPNWPRQSDAAHVRVWCKLGRTLPDLEQTVAQLAERQAQLGGATIQTQFQLGRSEGTPAAVVVTERHPPGSDLGTLKVEMWPPPEQIQHRYNFRVGTVQHKFFYDARAVDRVGDMKVWMTTGGRLFDGAIKVPEDDPLVVPIPPRDR